MIIKNIMEYSKLISATGISGLFEIVANKTDGVIVTSLEDGSKKFLSNRLHQFSHVLSVEIYTARENVNLIDVFLAMKNSEETLPSEKDAKAIKSYFEKVFPAMDFERVYNSDMKKMIKWFNQIRQHNIEIKMPEELTADNETTTQAE
jgi:hypothetical protein